MAIDFSRITIHSRGKGHSAVAAAAYRSGMTLSDDRTGVTYNYTNKEDIVFNKIILPEGGDAKFLDREKLWNEVEKNETRINSRVARDIVIALPKELSENEWKELSIRFAEEHFTSKGIVADLSIHNKEGNPHCHILVSTRRLVGDKFADKARELEGEMRHSKYGDFSAKNNILNDQWRDLQNEYFNEKNIDLSVDQNYLISQLHEGRIDNDEVHYIKEINKDRMVETKALALSDPSYALTYLTSKHTVFSIKDIESLSYKHSDSKEDYELIKNSILEHKDIINIGVGIDGKERFTTAYAAKKEYKLVNNVNYLKNVSTHNVKRNITEKAISNKGLSDEQKTAVKHLIDSPNIAAVIGKPGTGKSYMLNSAREVWSNSGYNVRGTALSGIAAAGLDKEAGIKSRTFASLMYSLEEGYMQLNAKDILVVDEAGMIDTYQMEKLINHVKKADAKLVLVGDPEQLQPIGAGAPLRAVLDNTGYVEMTKIRRQNIDWQKKATEHLSKGDIQGIRSYIDNNRFNFTQTSNDALSSIINDWNKETRPNNLLNSIIIAHRNVDVNNLNNAARVALSKRGIINSSDSIKFNSNKGSIDLSVGEKILFTKNNNELNVKNGTFGIVSDIDKTTGEIKVKIGINEDQRIVIVDPNKYSNISYGYAATLHKLQGATVDKSYLYVGGKGWNRNLTLVAASRHKKDLFIYADRETHSSEEKLLNSLSRETFKDSVLNHPISFSLRRGIDPDSVIGKAVDKLADKVEKIADKWYWLVNKQHYFERKQQKEKENVMIKNRKNAVILSKYGELKQDLISKKNEMENGVNGTKIYKHENYSDYYKKQVIFNKLGSFIYKNYERFEVVSEAQNYSIDTFKRNDEYNDYYKTAKSYVDSVLADNKDRLDTLSKIQNNRQKYSLHLNTLSNNLNYEEKEKVDKALLLDHTEHIYSSMMKGSNIDKQKELNLIKSFSDNVINYRLFWMKQFREGKNINLNESDSKYINKIKNELQKTSTDITKSISYEYSKDLLSKFNISEDTFFKLGNVNKSYADVARNIDDKTVVVGLNKNQQELVDKFVSVLSGYNEAEREYNKSKGTIKGELYKSAADKLHDQAKAYSGFITREKTTYSLMEKVAKEFKNSSEKEIDYKELSLSIKENKITPRNANYFVTNVNLFNNTINRQRNIDNNLNKGQAKVNEKDKGQSISY